MHGRSIAHLIWPACERVLQLRDECLCGWWSFCRFLSKPMQDSLLDLWGNTGVNLSRWRWRRHDVLNRCRVRRLGLERKLPRKKLVGDDREAVVIAGWYCLALCLLGSHILSCPDAHSGLRKMFLFRS